MPAQKETVLLPDFRGPACFGDINLSHTSPCHGCLVKAACAQVSGQGRDFGVMLWPRSRGGITVVEPGKTPDPSVLQVERLEPLEAGFHKIGLVQGSKRYHRWGLNRTKPIVDVREASASRIVLLLHAVRPNRVMELEAASKGVLLRPVVDEVLESQAEDIDEAIQEDRNKAIGTIAILQDSAVASDLVLQVTRSVWL